MRNVRGAQALLDYLETVKLDDRKSYETTVSIQDETYKETLNREQYLEFVLDITLNDLMSIIEKNDEP